MPQAEIRFDDGAEYETFMGRWSRLAGEVFVEWLAPPAELRWADVGCGNGAFTELLFERCAPARVLGIDPSEAQLEYARARLGKHPATFSLGDAMALPCAAASVDAAVMALVIFFVPEPARGVAEMARIVKPGGLVAAYAWDFDGGGFPYAALLDGMRAFGMEPVLPPSPQASRLDVLEALWRDGGLVDVETRAIGVERSFAGFDAWWSVAITAPRAAPRLASMPPDEATQLRAWLRERLPAASDGTIRVTAIANAVRGRRPPATH